LQPLAWNPAREPVIHHAAGAPSRPVKPRTREVPAGSRVGCGERRQAPRRPLSLAHAVGPTAPPLEMTGSPGPWPGVFVCRGPLAPVREARERPGRSRRRLGRLRPLGGVREPLLVPGHHLLAVVVLHLEPDRHAFRVRVRRVAVAVRAATLAVRFMCASLPRPPRPGSRGVDSPHVVRRAAGSLARGLSARARRG